MKQVEEKKVKDKQTRGASLISEYKAKLDQAKSSQEVIDINSWLLKESQVRDVEDVQQTAYYMLNNYGKKLEEKEKEEKKNSEITGERKGMTEYYKNIPVQYNGITTTGDVVAKSLIEQNPNIKADDLTKILYSLQIKEDKTVGFDPNKKIITIKKSKSSQALGEFDSEYTNIYANGGKLFVDKEGKYKDKNGKEITAQAGVFDAGIDQEINPSEISTLKGGSQILGSIYDMENPQPRGGGGGGYYGGGGGMTKEEKTLYSYAQPDDADYTDTTGNPIPKGEQPNGKKANGMRFAWTRASDFINVDEQIGVATSYGVPPKAQEYIAKAFNRYKLNMQHANKYPVGSTDYNRLYTAAQKAFWEEVKYTRDFEGKEGPEYSEEEKKNIDNFLIRISK